jgi:microcystin-dependent protein
LPTQQYNALYSVIGNQYGGNGPTNFALPNLNGMAPIHQGTGTGLTPRIIAQFGGSPTVTLNTTTIPNHSHQAEALASPGGTGDPTLNVWAEAPASGRPVVQAPLYAPTPNVVMNPSALTSQGGNMPHNNMQPFLPMIFIISMAGEYPFKP